MKALYDKTSNRISKLITNAYSTSFSIGIYVLDRKIHQPIYAIYGFVRLADEIVDSFHDFDKLKLLQEFKADTYQSIAEGISLNPVLNAFQATVNQYGIEKELIEAFLYSMEMDLSQKVFDQESFEKYILGSAEVVGLMCLRVFCQGNEEQYQHLKPSAMKLGAAFQKINFLRDLKQDFKDMGRSYFPNVDLGSFSESCKKNIEADIEQDFKDAYIGIKQLPKNSRLGVYTAYVYYYALFKKIQSTAPSTILAKRIRIPNNKKYGLLLSSYIKHSFNIL
ncbi:phytoene/squalene synthase family protein [Acidiluteibacter ferrifornacis]|uniref:Squalene/phytoene synthase family protein n=1 Tax=Acidiluteibacter ferrifornacis TaxID=2692424 RepID=A0A6N9NIG8_9FLAO|nr:phytoene/squalene synthase family protein [Acidiluteibacter ferrifornacis]NBG64997.1 squalene/phytoene synthase family protein [Acidiluteibacter ferrifornacis]